MRVTLIGGGGFVGKAFAEHLQGLGVSLQLARSAEYDASLASEVDRIIEDTKPDVILNCAGHTGKPNVDSCEQQKAECMQGNVMMPYTIKEVAKEKGVILGHVSSGCIFTGRHANGHGFRELDAPNFSFRQDNCSFYSGSKALGEEVLGYSAVANSDGSANWVNEDPDCYIWRLRIPFTYQNSRRNYLSKLMTYSSLLEAENSLSCLEDFAEASWKLISEDKPMGLYNVTNPGSISTSEVVQLIKSVGDEYKKKVGSSPFPEEFNFFKSEEDFLSSGAIAPRSNCVLDTTKLQDMGIHMPNVTEAVTKALRNWLAE